jgi:hypothetical protein
MFWVWSDSEIALSNKDLLVMIILTELPRQKNLISNLSTDFDFFSTAF